MLLTSDYTLFIKIKTQEHKKFETQGYRKFKKQKKDRKTYIPC